MKSLSEPGASTRSIVGPLNGASSRYQTLDHWRGLACLIIVIHHALLPMCDYSISDFPVSTPITTQQTTSATAEASLTRAAGRELSRSRPSKVRNWLVARLRVGVQFFFVISGYCIAATAYSLVNQKLPIKSYFQRRMMRIFPAYWCALMGSVLLCFVIDYFDSGLLQRVPWPLAMPWNLSSVQWLGSITLTETWISFFTQGSPNCFPIQAWTLCYELQFYAVFGILLGCSGRRFFRAIAIFTIAVAVFDFLFLCNQVRIRGLVIDEHWFMFAVGIGLFWDLNKATSIQAIRGRTMIAVVMIGLSTLASTTTLFGLSSQFSAWRIIEAVAFASLLLCLKRYDERISQIRVLDWLKSCGVMCYSIYLTHLFPVKLLSQQLIAAGFSDDVSILLICVPLALSTSISLGYIFHALVERRFLTDPPQKKWMSAGCDENLMRPLPILHSDEFREKAMDISVDPVVRINTDRVA